MRILLIWAVMMWGYASSAYALQVWGDLGPTLSLSSVVGHNNNQPETRKSPMKTSYGKMILSQLPIKPGQLENGKFQKYRIQNKISQPVCFVGADHFSLQWLKRYQTELAQHRANCFIVQAKDRDEVQAIANVAGDIIQPVNGVSTAIDLGVTHYPALVFNGVVTQ